MLTYKHISIVLSQRYEKDTKHYPSHKCICVFSTEGYHNIKFSDPYEQLMWP